MAVYHYSYHFVQKIEESDSSFLKYKLLYTFNSFKSHQWYWVWVEVYDYHFYAIKFHLKAHRNSRNKYSLMTGFNEARPVINTCIFIMQEIADKDKESSFGFIGANSAGESVCLTKRFRVYSRIMATYFAENIFEHYMDVQKSAYMLIRKTVLENHTDFLQKINAEFVRLYEYFE